MEREANLLRCAKLSCYSEFNRMVHAIARSGGKASLQPVSGAKMIEGSSGEYFFYTSLVSMLKQVIRNSNSESQQVELQQVYQWFCTNKPLIATKTSTKHQRPKLTFSNKVSPHSRPQTAPAALFPSSPASQLPNSSRTHRKPQTQHGFTSNYMSQSLALGHSPMSTTPHHQATHHLATSSRATVSPCTSNTQSRSGSGKQKSQHVSVVEMPSQNSIQQNQCPLTMTTLLHLAPSVAARMEWQREMRPYQAPVVSSRAILNAPPTTPGPAVECCDDDARDGTDVTRAVTAPVQLGRKEQSLSPPPQSPSPITTSPKPLTCTVRCRQLSSVRQRPSSVNVVTLTPPPHSHSTAKIQRSLFVLKRNGNVKAASGFNCSRYRNAVQK